MISENTSPSRNSVCSCGSGKKYKRCCGQNSRAITNAALCDEIKDLRKFSTQRLSDLYKVGATVRKARRDASYWYDILNALRDAKLESEAARYLSKFFEYVTRQDEQILSAIVYSYSDTEHYTFIRDQLSATLGATLQSARLRGLAAYRKQDAEDIKAVTQEFKEKFPDSVFFISYALATLPSDSEEWSELLKEGCHKFSWSVDIAEKFIYHSFRTRRVDNIVKAKWLTQLSLERNRKGVLVHIEDLSDRLASYQLFYDIAVAYCERDHRKLASAAEAFITTKSRTREYRNLFGALCLAFDHLDDYESAEKVCQAVLASGLDVDSFLVLSVRMNHFFASRKNSKALRIAESAYRKHESDTDLRSLYWRALAANSRASEALQEAECASDVDPGDLSFLAACDGELGKAKYYYSQICDKDGPKFDRDFHLAVILLLEKKFEESEKLFHSVLKRLEKTSFDTASQLVHFTEQDSAVSELLQFSRKISSSISYSAEVLQKLQSLSVLKSVISFLSMPSLSSASSIFTIAESGTPVQKAQVEFELQLQANGDLSYMQQILRENIACFDSLSIAAKHSLINAEYLLKESILHDASLSIMSYSRAFEIFLREAVFETFKDSADASSIARYDADYKASHNKKSSTLYNYLCDSKPLQIGSMQYILSSAKKYNSSSVLLQEFYDFILSNTIISSLGDENTIETLRKLSALRNTAAHEGIATDDQALKCREYVFELFNQLRFTSKEMLHEFRLSVSQNPFSEL